MCNIKGHNLFTWLFQPTWSWKKLSKHNAEADTKKINSQIAATEKEIEELNKPESNEVEGEMPVPTVPLNTQGTGINALPRVGLNL